MFKSVGQNSLAEWSNRLSLSGEILKFGVEFLDHALRGIFPDDLILIGAPSGIGKTQLCCNIALANLSDERKVHYIALEASEFEIERRLKYPLIAERFFGDPERPILKTKFNFPDWLMGSFSDELSRYEEEAHKFFETAYRDLFIFNKSDKFGINELIESVCHASAKTDLIIIDHVHYFDFEERDENRAIKEIAKTVRTLALEEKKPIILVAHLRKKDRHNEELCADLDEFHGSSDLYKIATKVITFASGGPDQKGNFKTYFRIPKNRIDGGVTRFLGEEKFNPKKGGYEQGVYKIGWANQKRSTEFVEVGENFRPEWAKPVGSPNVLRNFARDLKGQKQWWVDKN
jgi:KaiC/GvpD/RAD55 family RecA-like ATPase